VTQKQQLTKKLQQKGPAVSGNTALQQLAIVVFWTHCYYKIALKSDIQHIHVKIIIFTTSCRSLLVETLLTNQHRVDCLAVHAAYSSSRGMYWLFPYMNHAPKSAIPL